MTRFLLILALSSPSLADEVYRYVGADGEIYYSSSPRSEIDRPVALPEVKRENIDERIRSIQAQTPKSCVKHGGVDCRRGADSDGSVICLDGYQDALLPFRFACLEVKLQLDQIRFVEDEGGAMRERSVTLSVRNLSDVAASGVKVTVMDPPREAAGPEVIEPFGIAEYTTSELESSTANTPKISYRITCQNCAGAISGKRKRLLP